MKKIILSIVLAFVAVATFAQVPYFAGTAGDGNLYGYTSLKTRPGTNNSMETYTTFQYGLGDYTAVGTDIYTGPGSAYWGFLVRAGYKVNKYFGVGGQVTPSFDLHDNFKYSYTTAALYMNGAITKDGNLFWCSNTWWGINKGADNSITNWEYLGYAFGLKNGDYITPMVGMSHDWKFEAKPDMMAGFYYTRKCWNFYVWGSDFCNQNAKPRVVVGVDFKLPTKSKK